MCQEIVMKVYSSTFYFINIIISASTEIVFEVHYNYFFLWSVCSLSLLVLLNLAVWMNMSLDRSFLSSVCGSSALETHSTCRRSWKEKPHPALEGLLMFFRKLFPNIHDEDVIQRMVERLEPTEKQEPLNAKCILRSSRLHWFSLILRWLT